MKRIKTQNDEKIINVQTHPLYRFIKKLKNTWIIIILYEIDETFKMAQNNQCTDTLPLRIYLYSRTPFIRNKEGGGISGIVILVNIIIALYEWD